MNELTHKLMPSTSCMWTIVLGLDVEDTQCVVLALWHIHDSWGAVNATWEHVLSTLGEFVMNWDALEDFLDKPEVELCAMQAVLEGRWLGGLWGASETKPAPAEAGQRQMSARFLQTMWAEFVWFKEVHTGEGCNGSLKIQAIGNHGGFLTQDMACQEVLWLPDSWGSKAQGLWKESRVELGIVGKYPKPPAD